MADDRENCPKCGRGKMFPAPAMAGQTMAVLRCAACGHELRVEAHRVPEWAPHSPESRARERRQLAAVVVAAAALIALLVYYLH